MMKKCKNILWLLWILFVTIGCIVRTDLTKAEETRKTYSGTSKQESGTTGKVYTPNTVAEPSIYKDMDYKFLRDFGYGTHVEGVIATFNSIKEMKASNMKRLVEGATVRTQGYAKKGDGGGCAYRLSKKSGTGAIQMDNELYAIPLADVYVDPKGKKWYVASVRQYGAMGGGTEAEQVPIAQCYTRLNELVNGDENIERGIVYLPEGEYKCDDCVSFTCKNLNMVGEGSKTILFTDNDYRKTSGYQEHFFQSWGSENMYLGNFTLQAREVDMYRYMRQFSLMYSKQMYIYNVDMLIPQECYHNYYYEDKQYSNFCCYTGNSDITVDGCKMVQMTSTYRGANIGVLDIWAGGEENITIMNCELHSDARDEQIGFFGTSNTKSFLHNIEFINNTIYSYEPRYSNIVGNATMRFTVAYSNSNDVTNVHIAGNHFITECDSKFMTFGAVKKCVVEDNIIEVLCSYATTGAMVFDSAAHKCEDVLIQHNDFFITSRANFGKGCMSSRRVTFNNNRVFCDKSMPFGMACPIMNDNEINMLHKCGPVANHADEFNHNLVRLFAGCNYQGAVYYSFATFGGTEDKNKTDEENHTITNNVIVNCNNNTIYNYVREYERRNLHQSAVTLLGDLISMNFIGNKYYEPNTRYTSSTYSADVAYQDDRGKYYLGKLFKKRYGEYGSVIVKDNIIQNMNEEKDGDGFVCTNNTYLPPTGTLEELTSHTDLVLNGEVVKEITTTGDRLDFDDLEYIAESKDEEGKVIKEKQVHNKDVMWFTSVEELATVDKDGVVTRKQYGDVYVYAVPMDGSEDKYGKCLVHFAKKQATSITTNVDTINLQPGLKQYIECQVQPVNEANQNLQFESTDKSVATVTSIGKVEAVATGSCVIICRTTDGSGLKKEIPVKVGETTVKKIGLTPYYYKFNMNEIGQKKDISIRYYYPETSINKKIGRWESTNEKVAKVVKSDGQSATIESVAAGVAYIRAYSTDGTCFGQCGVFIGPDRVENLRAKKVTNNAIPLYWDEKPYADGYYVYQWNAEKCEWEEKTVITQREKSAYTFSDLEQGKEYKFCVKAYVNNWTTGANIIQQGEGAEITVSTFDFVPVSQITAAVKYLSLSEGDKAIFEHKGKTYENPTFIVSAKNAEQATNNELSFSYDESIIDLVKIDYDKKKYTVYVNALKEGDTNIEVTAKDGSGEKLVIPVRVRQPKEPSCVTGSTIYGGKIQIDFGAVKTTDEQGREVVDESGIDGYLIQRYVSYHFEDQVYIPKENKELYSYTYYNIPDEVSYHYAVYTYTYDGTYYYLMGHKDTTGKTVVSTKMQSLTSKVQEYEIEKGCSQEIAVEIAPADVSIRDLDWESMDTDVFTVQAIESESGTTQKAIVTAIAGGKAMLNVYATDGTGLVTSIKIVVPGGIEETPSPEPSTAEPDATVPSGTEGGATPTGEAGDNHSVADGTGGESTGGESTGTPTVTTGEAVTTNAPAATNLQQPAMVASGGSVAQELGGLDGVMAVQKEKDAKKSAFAPLQLRANEGKNSIQLSWKKVAKADGYIVYYGICGKKALKQQIVSKKKLKVTLQKLQADTYYKCRVVAYKKKGSKKKVLAISKNVYSCVKNCTYGNPEKITGVKAKITLKKGKKLTLQPTVKYDKENTLIYRAVSYEVNHKKIATVNKKGLITAKKKGTCILYVYTQNGICQKVKIKVTP